MKSPLPAHGRGRAAFLTPFSGPFIIEPVHQRAQVLICLGYSPNDRAVLPAAENQRRRMQEAPGCRRSL
jgi:hypothetical protein